MKDFIDVMLIVTFAVSIFVHGFVWGHSAGVKRGRELAAEARDEPQAAE